MAPISLRSVVKRYGAFEAIRDLDAEIEDGKFTVLVGPSGCGKSTLLRLIAGLEDVSSGEIEIGGVVVNDVPPKARNIAMVFQNYALYPHMNVSDNMSFALRLRNESKETIASMVGTAADTLGLGYLLDRLPAKLSGGQRQRVAMGRAIVRDPSVFLFDEPLSNLDAALRVHMRKEIRALHNRLGVTSVYVTHDQIEAMTMADHVVVMRDGGIEQEGAPLDLYDYPANIFVAGFIGSPAMNFIDGVVVEGGGSAALPALGNSRLPLVRPGEPGRSVRIGLRPEFLKVTDPETAPIRVPVRAIEQTGSTSYLFTESEPELSVLAMGRLKLHPGDMVGLTIAPELIHLFDPSNGRCIDN